MFKSKRLIVLVVVLVSVIMASNLSNASAGNPFNRILNKLNEIIQILEENLLPVPCDPVPCEPVPCEPIELGVPKTGQTTSHAAGDDGDLEMGVNWPIPRFTDNGNGTVTDNLTGLIWLKDANCIFTNYPELGRQDDAIDGGVSWQQALDFVAGINDGTYAACGAGYTDWRLPNLKELHSLIDFGQYDPALPLGHPFSNVVIGWQGQYWSGTTYEPGPTSAWFVLLPSGYVSYGFKSNEYIVWPVRGGN